MAGLSTIPPPPSSVHVSGTTLFRKVPNRGSVSWRQMFITRTTGSSVRSSGDVPADTAAAADNSGSETAVEETPREPPSLISSLNVQRALRGIPITDVDHYARLGLPRGCSYLQVESVYRDKLNELMNQGLDEGELKNKTELLKESYSILSSMEERRMYDWSLSRTETPNRYVWPFEVDITQTPTEEPPPPEPEDVGPTRALGYFMFGWFILSAALSIAFNR